MSDFSTSQPAITTRLWQIAVLNAALTVFLFATFAWNGVDLPGETECATQLIDFHVFWGAAQLALEGQALAVFDHAALRSAFGACETNWMPWLHPPFALTLLTPFALLPMAAAWVAFNLVSLAALGAALARFTGGLSAVWLGCLLAPAVLPALLQGQIILLWIAGFLGAIAALRADRPILAGLLIALLTVKPTLGLLIPLALLAIGAWRTIAVAAVATVLLHGAATLLYGFEYWSLLADITSTHGDKGLAQLQDLEVMASMAAVMVRLGAAPELALQINLALTVLLALSVFMVWRRLGARSDAAVAVLAAAIPAATPYLWFYDGAFLAVAALFLLRTQTGTIGPAMIAALVMLWIGPGLWVWNATLTDHAMLLPVWYIPPLMLLALILGARQANIDARHGK